MISTRLNEIFNIFFEFRHSIMSSEFDEKQGEEVSYWPRNIFTLGSQVLSAYPVLPTLLCTWYSVKLNIFLFIPLSSKELICFLIHSKWMIQAVSMSCSFRYNLAFPFLTYIYVYALRPGASENIYICECYIIFLYINVFFVCIDIIHRLN